MPLNLCFLIFYMIVYETTPTESTMAQASLSLQKELEIFGNCTVYIVQNTVEMKKVMCLYFYAVPIFFTREFLPFFYLTG